MVDTQLIAHDKEVYDIAWGGVGVFASVSADGSVRVFDLRLGTLCIAWTHPIMHSNLTLMLAYALQQSMPCKACKTYVWCLNICSVLPM